MKKYVKPTLKELGLLREVTKFSSAPDPKCRGFEYDAKCYAITL